MSPDALASTASIVAMREPTKTEKTKDLESASEEALHLRIEKLGRERPPSFSTLRQEILFVFSISMSQLLTEYFVSGFTVILPTLIRDLDIPQASSVWPATAFSLVIGSTLLVFGRLGDMWGGYPVFVAGLSWLLLWSIVAGFSINPIMLDLCRALQGLGGAAFLPTGVMLMGSAYRPGPRKNLVFSIYGTLAIFGFFFGIFIAGVVGQYLRWGWYFWIGGILATITLVSSIFGIPTHVGKPAENKDVGMDYLGGLTIVAGILLTVFALTQSAHAEQGWRTPYIPVCFVLGVLSLFAAVYIETCVASHPLLPPSIFKISAMTPLLLALLLLYGTWGIFSVYGTLYFQNIMGASPFQVVAWYAPLGIGGFVISLVEGFILHLVPGKVLLIISGSSAVVAQILLALIPGASASYWAWIFPAMILGTIGIDLSTILATVFVTTSVPAEQQGLAGGLVNSMLQLGVAYCLGITDIIQVATVDEQGLAKSYKNTFWAGVGVAGAALVILTIWAKVPKATSELTADEKRELMLEAEREVASPTA